MRAALTKAPTFAAIPPLPELSLSPYNEQARLAFRLPETGENGLGTGCGLFASGKIRFGKPRQELKVHGVFHHAIDLSNPDTIPGDGARFLMPGAYRLVVASLASRGDRGSCAFLPAADWADG
jgi:hypothetical protein